MLSLACLARCRHEASSGDQRERAPQCLHIPRRKAASFSPASVHLENEGNAAKRVSVESDERRALGARPVGIQRSEFDTHIRLALFRRTFAANEPNAQEGE